jgi:D(-)-tartrate dehydratase
MKIVAAHEKTVPVASAVRNAGIGFGSMTASALVLVSDVVRDGKPVVGLAFDSIGRYGHGGLLRERFLPRLLKASADAYADQTRTGSIDPFRVWSVVMQDEKPGGHGERPAAVGLIDAAAWDLVAKLEEKPLWRVLAERFRGGDVPRRVPNYASGGHYRPGDDIGQLRDELRRYHDLGYRRMKIKIGGAPIEEDRRRIEAAVAVVGTGNLAVDCNGTLSSDAAHALFQALQEYGLAWFEEPVDPLDYALHAELAGAWTTPIGTGENIFSFTDTRNLLRHGGLRSDRDWLQMDVSLSYGIPEYLRIIEVAEQHGWSRRRFLPHAGHLFSLQVVVGLGLGGHEAAPDPMALMGGYARGTVVEDGFVRPGDAPGVGFEAKDNLAAIFREMMD